MNRSKIFFQHQETDIIQNIIYKYGNSEDTYQLRLEKYISHKAYYFIKFHNHNLDFKSYEIYQMPYPELKHYLFAIILTKTNTNHPYLLYFNTNDKYIYYLIPIGGENKQGNFETFNMALSECNIGDKAAIYILVEKTIIIRKKGIIESNQFSIISCNNISNCIRKFHEIDKMKISQKEKQNLKTKANEYYLQKAIEFLKYYFNLLDMQEYDDAWEFLKGDDKYFGKQRLNTFFKNTKSIIGHLEIFIALYELFFNTREMLFNI